MTLADERYEVLASRTDLGDGDARAVRHDERDVLLCREHERIYAFEDRCPHQGKSLAGGRIRNGQIACPHHGARFDLATGRGLQQRPGACLVPLDIRLTATEVQIRRRSPDPARIP